MAGNLTGNNLLSGVLTSHNVVKKRRCETEYISSYPVIDCIGSPTQTNKSKSTNSTLSVCQSISANSVKGKENCGNNVFTEDCCYVTESEKNRCINNRLKVSRMRSFSPKRKTRSVVTTGKTTQELKRKKYEIAKPKCPLNNTDVCKGTMLFVWNLTLDTTDTDLRKRFSAYGKINYAEVCINKAEKLSEGVAFVRFKDQKDADKCLRISCDYKMDGGITLKGNRVYVCLADRNMYLAIEGRIRQNSRAGMEMSTLDLHKRLRLEIWRRKMFEDPNCVVSNTRLYVENFSHDMTADKLREIFLKAGGNGAEITNCKIIRKSRRIKLKFYQALQDYALVSFTKQEQALRALREINNNPETFTGNQRPIVVFNLEIVRAKHIATEQRVTNGAKRSKKFESPREKYERRVLLLLRLERVRKKLAAEKRLNEMTEKAVEKADSGSRMKKVERRIVCEQVQEIERKNVVKRWKMVREVNRKEKLRWIVQEDQRK